MSISERDYNELPLGVGPPTRKELELYYPAKFTWEQLKIFVNSGDLGLIKRDKALHQRYENWVQAIKVEYGSSLNYLLNHRLQWGKPDTQSLLCTVPTSADPGKAANGCIKLLNGLPVIPADAPAYFTADTPPGLISIILNDWPGAVPLDVVHSLVWTCLPILPPPSLLPPHIAATLPPSLLSKVTDRLKQDGVWGFTGLGPDSPPLDLLPESLGALSEWGITIDQLIKSPRGTPEEEAAIKLAGEEVQKFVKKQWKEDEWETAWFVNPPRLQSVKDLAHVHVYAKKKAAI